MDDAEIVEVRDRAALRRWLARHHTRDAGVWLTIHKRGATGGSLAYDEAVREALCYGWIDATARKLDDERYLLWYAPRRPGSGWSAVNKRRIEELVADGSMAEPGLAAIGAAKADGSWSRLDRSDALEVPDDLEAAFERRPGSRAHWDGFPPGVRKQLLGWIYSAKRDETRARRVDETASQAARGERANQWRPKG